MSEAIVLAGGLGSRLKSVVAEVPKPMAPIRGRPFLAYLLVALKAQGLTRVVLSTGYKSESIENFFGDSFEGLELIYSREDRPLGTGGALQQAFTHCLDNECFVLNGDSFFEISLARLKETMMASGAELVMALKEMKDFDRYGCVGVNSEGRVTAFEEKKSKEVGFINGGVYLAKTSLLKDLTLKAPFSFEIDFLNKQLLNKKIFACVQNGYFVDIGIPEDYERAQREMPHRS